MSRLLTFTYLPTDDTSFTQVLLVTPPLIHQVYNLVSTGPDTPTSLHVSKYRTNPPSYLMYDHARITTTTTLHTIVPTLGPKIVLLTYRLP